MIKVYEMIEQEEPYKAMCIIFQVNQVIFLE